MTEFNAANLKERCERGRIVGDPTSTWKSVTGEPYVVIGEQSPSEGQPAERGTIDEGKSCELALDQETAYFQALACFETYANARSGKLYWRREPEIKIQVIDHLTRERPLFRYRFYMRCLISDKAEIQTVEALLA